MNANHLALHIQAKKNEIFFRNLYETEKLSPHTNAKYLLHQAGDYLRTFDHGTDDIACAMARSELSRVIALAYRECIHYGWDFHTLLAEGVEYEMEVVRAVESGERGRRSQAKGIG